LTKIVGKTNYGVLFDPFEEKFFGHACKHKITQNQILELNCKPTRVFGTRGYSCNFSLYIGCDAKTPLLIQVNKLRTTDDLDMSDVFFNPLDGRFLQLQNIKHLGDFASNYPYYYEKNFLAYSNRSNIFYYDSWVNVLDVDIRQQYNTLRLTTDLTTDSLIIVQPKISSQPKVLNLGFKVENVFKHPTEPMLVAYNNKQYVVIDLDVE
jgi:hypothetical protein